MAEDNKKKDDVVEVPKKLLVEMQEKMAEMERKQTDMEAKNAGLEELFSKDADTEGKPKLREKKTFEPKFRTIRIRKYPIAGNPEDMGWVVGWTSRGAYQQVDRSGVSPQMVDFLDIFFLGRERNKDGKLQAEQVKLLDLMNAGQQIHCKIIDVKRTPRVEPTGEEIDVSVWDPQHGLIATGDKIDGFVAYSDITYIVQVPGVDKPLEIDAMFVN